jgi:hypothetical protein
MTAVCREGHLSDEADYCSVCGAQILSSPAAPAAPPAGSSPAAKTAVIAPGTGASSACPACGETREDPDARFCEVCRYDFQEKKPGPPPVARAAAPKPAPAPAPAPPSVSKPTPIPFPAVVATPAPAGGWDLEIVVDPALDTDPDPESPCPTDRPAITQPVDKPDMLVGRHDETRAIHPEISLHDPGASRRHAKFVLEPDGGIALQDLASTNGTQVNGADVAPGTRRRLKEGDTVTLGRWTRITVKGRS